MVQITLTDEEQSALNKSADAVRDLVDAVKKFI
jgi:malate/lactate dehydrogenase